jgi:hypothetical protein
MGDTPLSLSDMVRLFARGIQTLERWLELMIIKTLLTLRLYGSIIYVQLHLYFAETVVSSLKHSELNLKVHIFSYVIRIYLITSI